MSGREILPTSPDAIAEAAKVRLKTRLGESTSKLLNSAKVSDLSHKLLEMEMELMRLELKNVELERDRGKVVEWDNDGKPLDIVGPITSISDRKEAEQALTASERELRLIANHIPGPLSRVDRNERYLFVNDAYQSLFGKERFEIVGKTMAEILPPDLYQQVQPNIAKVLTGERVTFESKFRLRSSEDQFTLMNFIPEFDERRNIQGFIIVGSCFRLSIPVELPEGSCWVDQNYLPKPIEPIPARQDEITLDGRILLAEDGIDNQKLIAFHLRKVGAIVEVAENGRIALEMIDTAFTNGEPFDLLLTDIQMPEMDGYELTQTLRARGSRMPIVALTAHALVEDRQKCMHAGCNDYESKPIIRAQLLAMCKKWLTSTMKSP